MVGFGSAVILLPVCAYVFGAEQAVPFAAVGAFVFVQLDVELIHRLLGAFILPMIPARHGDPD